MSMHIFGRYEQLFKVEGVKPLVTALVLARLPTGCMSILLVLFVSLYHGASVAGLSVAALTIGTACVAPFLGRLVDAGKGPATLRLTAVAQALACIMLVLVVRCGAPSVMVVVSAFLCGALQPPVAGTTRSLWKSLVPDYLLATAYSFEILLIDVLYVSGPLLAGVFIACGVAEIGIVAVTVGLVVGSVALSCQPPVKEYARLGREGRGRAEGRKDRGLLRLPAVWMLLLACLAACMFSGWMETLLPLYYTAQGVPAQGSIAISVWSIGSIVGVLAFVRLQSHLKIARLSWQLVLCTAVYLVSTALLGLTLGFVGICIALFLVGLTVSPCTNLHYQIGGILAPEGHHAEMFSWLNTATSAGISLGAALSGATIDALGYTDAFRLPILCVVGALLLALVLALKTSRSREGVSDTLDV